jgi:hypothetical protein
MSTNTSEPPQRFKRTKRILNVAAALLGITTLYSYPRLMEIFILRKWNTKEEVDECRELAQKIIAECDGNVTSASFAALGPDLMSPFARITLKRYADATPEVRHRMEAGVVDETHELIGAVFSGDRTRAMRAGISFLLYPAYTPEEIEIIQSSEKAQKLLIKGVLLRSDQLRELQARQWGDGGDGDGREGGESLGGGGGEEDAWSTALRAADCLKVIFFYK